MNFRDSEVSSDVVVIEEEMGDSDRDGSDFPDVKLERATEIDAQVIVCAEANNCFKCGLPKFSIRQGISDP